MQVIHIAFIFFLIAILSRPVLPREVDVLPHFELSSVLPTTEFRSVEHSVFFKGISKTPSDKEDEGEPKEISSGTHTRIHASVETSSQRAQIMGWKIGIATATNGRSYPNQDNFMIKLYSEPCEGDTQALCSTIGVFAIMDGHLTYGEIASQVAVETVTRYSDFIFSNYSRLAEGTKMQMQQMASMGYQAEPNDTKLQAHLFDKTMTAAIGNIYYQVEKAIFGLNSEYVGTTFTLVVWDLKQQKLYTASAGDSLAYMGRAKNATLELISAEHGANAPKQQQQLRASIQNYFIGAQPQKVAYRGSINVVWQTPGSKGWPNDLKYLDMAPPHDEGFVMQEPLQTYNFEDADTEDADSASDENTRNIQNAEFDIDSEENEEEDEDETLTLSSKSKEESDDSSEIGAKSQETSSTTAASNSLNRDAPAQSQAPSLVQIREVGAVLDKDGKKELNNSTSSNESETPSVKYNTSDADVENLSPPNSVGVDRIVSMIREKMLSLPRVLGQHVPPGKVPGYAALFYRVINYNPGIFEELRLGLLAPTRSIGDGGRGKTVNSLAFVRSDPEIMVFDLTNMDASDFIVLTSDGFTNVHATVATEKVYSERVQACRNGTDPHIDTNKMVDTSSGPMNCLDDPKFRYDEWYNSTEVFSKSYDDAHEAFTDAVTKLTTASMYKLITETIASTSTLSEGANAIIEKTKEIQEKTTFKWSDDITFMYIQRTPLKTERSFQRHEPFLKR